MFPAEKIYVDDEASIVRTLIGFTNLKKPDHKKITGMEFRFFEALVFAQKEFGTINSLSADNFVKEYVGKPDMIRKSFRTYRNALVEKGWLANNKETYILPASFNRRNNPFKESGVVMTIVTELFRNETVDGANPRG